MIDWHSIEDAPTMERLLVHWSVDQGYDGSFEIGTMTETGAWLYGWEKETAKDCPRPTHYASLDPPGIENRRN